MNGFLELAKRQLSTRTKTRQRRAARVRRHGRRCTRVRHAVDNQHERLRHFRGAGPHRILAGPHGRAARHLVQFLESMTVLDAPALIALVKLGGWQHTDPNTRHEILSLIDDHLTRLRVDDRITGQHLIAFQQIREMLR